MSGDVSTTLPAAPVPSAHGPDGAQYPVQLSLAYLFLMGYLARTAFLFMKLPGAVGVILSGFLFSFFIQVEIKAARDTLQGLAFFLVLLTAGFEIKLSKLKPFLLVYALLPCTMECLAIASFAVHFKGYHWIEGLILGCTLFGVGDGLVIPRMIEFSATEQFKTHPMPRFVFMCAPLEASYALTLYGVLAGLAEPRKNPHVEVAPLVAANVLRILATLLFGFAAGKFAGYLISNRDVFKIHGRQVFNGNNYIEAYLMILAVALAGFGLGSDFHGKVVVPIFISAGSLFQPELLVIVIGCFFGNNTKHHDLESIIQIVSGVWVFGQIILFSMLGSKTDISVFTHIFEVFPLMIVGLAARFVGALIATVVAVPCRCSSETCRRSNQQYILKDATFFFLSMLPRATLQGALGPKAIHEKLFASRDRVKAFEIENFVAVAARLYIVFMSIVGSVLLDLFGPTMLEETYGPRHCEECQEEIRLELLEEQLLEEEELEMMDQPAGLVFSTSGVFNLSLPVAPTSDRKYSSVSTAVQDSSVLGEDQNQPITFTVPSIVVSPPRDESGEGKGAINEERVEEAIKLIQNLCTQSEEDIRKILALEFGIGSPSTPRSLLFGHQPSVRKNPSAGPGDSEGDAGKLSPQPLLGRARTATMHSFETRPTDAASQRVRAGSAWPAVQPNASRRFFNVNGGQRSRSNSGSSWTLQHPSPPQHPSPNQPGDLSPIPSLCARETPAPTRERERLRAASEMPSGYTSVRQDVESSNLRRSNSGV